jgi:polyhydroxyalkanoate synthase subunit PhaC
MAEQQNLFQFPEIKGPDAAKLAESFRDIAEHSQQLMQQVTQRNLSGDHFTIPDRMVVAKTFMALTERMLSDPGRLFEAQSEYYQHLMTLWQTTAQRLHGEETPPVIAPEPGDKRFKDEAWQENPYFDFLKQAYLLSARSILHSVQAAKAGMDAKTAEKVDFYTRQYLDALSPSNFPQTNPQVLKATLESGGENLIKGLENLLEDMARGKGDLRIRMTDLEAFKLGENVAITPGKVVFQTPLMQLIQYTPTTEQVYQRPLLIVPPWINKFYILDLRPRTPSSSGRWTRASRCS